MNEKRINLNYVRRVVGYLKADRETIDRIRNELLDSLASRRLGGDDRSPYEIFGEPKETAFELSTRYGIEFCDYYAGGSVLGRETPENGVHLREEYRSEITIGGLPLVHIVRGRNRTAKGVIGIGPFAVGVIAIGGISAGLISVGGISLGLFALGGIVIALLGAVGSIALSLLCSLGGVAVSYFFSMGGLAVAYHLAIGGFALANDVAIGAESIAMVAGFTDPSHFNSISDALYFFLPDRAEHFLNAVDTSFPHYHSVLRKIVEFFVRITMNIS